MEKLHEIEALCATGRLCFRSPSGEGEVRLTRGEFAEGDDEALEELLELREGSFWIIQELPSLSVSRGDATRKEGSLEVHVPADLMNYCERAGLSGALAFSFRGASATLKYRAGELSDIELSGVSDLSDVFGWTDGAFVIHAREEKSKRESTEQFLTVVEVALREIEREREERRPATRSSPEMPPLPTPSELPTLKFKRPKPEERRKDQTVRVIYINDDKESEPPRAKSAKEKKMSEAKTEVTSEANDESRGLPRTLVSVAITLFVMILALVIIAQLPPLD